MKQPHFAHIHCRVWNTHAHEVRVYERPSLGAMGAPDGNSLDVTYAALDWLQERGWRQIDAIGEPWDWDINMHGGAIGFTSFWFRDPSKAVEFKLVWAGVEAR